MEFKRDGVSFMRTALTILLVFSLFIGASLIFYAYKRHSLPGARYFILLIIAILLYNFGYIGEINADTFPTAMFWFDFEHIAIPSMPYLWLMMCLDYTQFLKRIRLIRGTLLIYLLIYYIVYYTNRFHHLYITSYRFESNGYFPVIIAEKGPMYLALICAISVMGVACTLLYFRGWLQSTRLHKSSYLLMMIASLMLWITMYLNTTNTNYLGIDYYPICSIFSGVLYLFCIFRYSIFNTIPIATKTVFQLSEDAIALSDIGGRLMDVNESFLRLYPELKKLEKKHTLEGFIEYHKELEDLSFASPSVSFQLKHKEELRHFTAQLTQIRSASGVFIGAILSIKDITLYVEHQRQLEILAANALMKAESNELSFLQAQISPHFINNTLSTISSLISRDDNAAKDLVVDLSEYLISCYRADNSSPMSRLWQELEAVDTYIRIVKKRFGERLNFIVSVDAPKELELPRLVLQPLVENAVRHGVLPKKEGGTVELHVWSSGGFACFEVKDDGVGIEPERIEALLMGSDHQQGVGIINIHKRLLKYYGGGLTIQSDQAVTTVSFYIPLPEELLKG